MSKVVDQAKDLIKRYDESGFIHRDATMLLPGLVAECERLLENQCTPEKCYGEIARLQEELKITSDRAAHNAQRDAAREQILREELAKWQKIANTAIDHNASERAYMAISAKGWSDWKTLKEHDPETANVFIEQATRELGIATSDHIIPHAGQEFIFTVRCERDSSDHIGEANQLILTNEQRAALEIACKSLWKEFEVTMSDDIEFAGKIVRSMLS